MRVRPALSIAIIAILGSVGIANAQGGASETPRVLPDVVVTEAAELPKPESWHYVELPGFELLTTLSERETKRFIRDFHLLQQVIQTIWPVVTRSAPSLPVTIILCGRRAKFDSFLPVNRERDKYEVAGIFLTDPERTTIVIDFLSSEILDPNKVSVEEGNFMTPTDPYREFYLGYFRHLIRRSSGSKLPPPWLEEGLVQLLAKLDFSKKHVAIGQVGDGWGAFDHTDFVKALSERGLIKFETLFTATEPPENDRTGYSMQCYAFVHMCLYGRNQRYQKPFLKFAERAMTEPVTEAMFNECFGLTYKKAASELRSYVEFTDYKLTELRAKRGTAGFADPPAFVVREATQAEIGRIKGEALELGGHTGAAHAELSAPARRGEKEDARLLAAIGLHERRQQNHDRARKYLEAAVRERAPRPLAYVELARLRRSEIAAKRSETDAPGLNSEQTTFVLEPLRSAHRQRLGHVEIYDEMAETWMVSTATPAKEDLVPLFQASIAYPGRLRLIYLTANLAARNGIVREANALIEHGVKWSPDEIARQRFEALRALLPAPAPAPTKSAETTRPSPEQITTR